MPDSTSGGATQSIDVRIGDSAALVVAISSDRSPGRLDVRTFSPMPDVAAQERPITVDQTNVSVVVGERVVVKWMRPRSWARAPELLAHLAATGFRGTPTPYAAAYREGALVALITEYLPDAVDGWQWCVDDLRTAVEGGAPPDFGAALGRLTADLHAALATPSPVYSSPVASRPRLGGALAEAGLSTLDANRALDDELARHAPAMAAEIEALRQIEGPVTVIHPHGDLHVGQVLRWQHGYTVIDFDGNPAVPGQEWQPATRDVAQLRTSVLHAAQIVDKHTEGRHRTVLLAQACAQADELLHAYRARLAEHGLAELFDERLLRPFEVEQECRELLYAAEFLPRWRYAPMGVLRFWYG